METLRQQFESRVAGFLRHTGVGPKTFVRQAESDPNPVRPLRLGRSPRPATADPVPAFMEACDRTGRLRDSVLRQGESDSPAGRSRADLLEQDPANWAPLRGAFPMTGP